MSIKTIYPIKEKKKTPKNILMFYPKKCLMIALGRDFCGRKAEAELAEAIYGTA